MTTVFLHSHGQPFSFSGFTSYWKALMASTDMVASFGPKRLRYIFVTDRREHAERPGPEDAHAALVMGNSEAAWTAYYHTNFDSWGAQQAVDKMAEYRVACLEEVRGKQQQQLLQQEEQEEQQQQHEEEEEAEVEAEMPGQQQQQQQQQQQHVMEEHSFFLDLTGDDDTAYYSACST